MPGIEKLQDTTIRKAKPGEADYKLNDGGGLCMVVTKKGSKLWRFNYRFQGKHKTLALGIYPDVPLAKARERHREARELLVDGVDPGADRKEKALAAAALSENTLTAIALEWLNGPHAAKVEPSTAAKTRKLIEPNILDKLGDRPISEITAPELLAVLRQVEVRAAYSAHKIKQVCGQVWRYAIATGRAERDITADLRGALKPFKVKHHAAITDPARLGELLRAFDGYSGSLFTVAALKLAVMLFVRPGELRQARWADIDLDETTWAFTASKTKQAHIVPLSRQAVAILEGLRPVSGHLEYVFPGGRDKRRPMSENAVNAALRLMGFDGDDVVGHGFRATARTILDEVLGYPPHIVEQQLAHAVRDPLGRAYNRTAHLPQRQAMMQRWSDYLDELKAGGKVLRFKKAG